MQSALHESKSIRLFLYSVGTVLLVTAVAKCISAAGTARILQNPDPIFGIPFRAVLWIAGGIEIIIALICFFVKRLVVPISLVAWLATAFVFYRIGLVWVGYNKPCPCLGSLTDALHIPPQAADTGMKVILAYLLIGGYGSVLWLWSQNRGQHNQYNAQ
jgi:hypothetical protein